MFKYIYYYYFKSSKTIVDEGSSIDLDLEKFGGGGGHVFT